MVKPPSKILVNSIESILYIERHLEYPLLNVLCSVQEAEEIFQVVHKHMYFHMLEDSDELLQYWTTHIGFFSLWKNTEYTDFDLNVQKQHPLC